MQLSLVLVLLASAGLLLRSFNRLSNVETGFVADNLNVLSVQMPIQRYDKAARIALARDLERRLESMGDMQVTIAGGTR